MFFLQMLNFSSDIFLNQSIVIVSLLLRPCWSPEFFFSILLGYMALASLINSSVCFRNSASTFLVSTSSCCSSNSYFRSCTDQIPAGVIGGSSWTNPCPLLGQLNQYSRQVMLLSANRSRYSVLCYYFSWFIEERLDQSLVQTLERCQRLLPLKFMIQERMGRRKQDMWKLSRKALIAIPIYYDYFLIVQSLEHVVIDYNLAMSQFMKHFYYCRQIIENNNKNDTKAEEFSHHVDNLLAAQQDESKKVEELLPILLKDIIIKHDQHFLSLFQILVNKGANLNFVEKKEDKSLLMISCAQGSAETVRAMLSKGVATSHRDARNHSCLFYALENKGGAGIEIVKMLLAADNTLVNLPASNNRTILFAAVEKGKSQYVRVLLENGAAPDECVSDQLDTPLHQAMRNLKNQKRELAKNELKQMIRLLLRHETNYNLKNKQGKTAAEIDPAHEEFILSEIRALEEAKAKRVSKPKEAPLAKIGSRILELRKTIQELESQIQQVSPPIHLPAIPLNKMYIPDKELQLYLSQEILWFAENIDRQKLVLKSLLNTVFEDIKKKLSEMKITLHLFSSRAADLHLSNSQLKISVVPDVDLGAEQQALFLTAIESHLKKMELLSDLKLHKDALALDAIWQQADGARIQIRMRLSKHQDVEDKRVGLINQCLVKFPYLKHLVYVLKHLLRSMNLNDPHLGGLGTYGLTVLLASFMKAQKQLLGELESEQISCGELLLSFLNAFGLQFDYLDKGVFLSFSEKGYIYNLDLKLIPKLVISDPVSDNVDIGADIGYTTTLRNLFKMSYFTLKVNSVCHNQCESRQRILKNTKGTLEDSVKPCCILKRLFQRYSATEKPK